MSFTFSVLFRDNSTHKKNKWTHLFSTYEKNWKEDTISYYNNSEYLFSQTFPTFLGRVYKFFKR